MNIHLGVKGFYKLEAVRPDGTRRLLADWFPNLITNIGLDRIGQAAGFDSCAAHCRVGSGSATPLVTDTQLQSQVAVHSGAGPGATNGGVGSPPYYGYGRYVYRFNVGVATGNLTEVGVGWTTSGATLFSRSLIKDELGDPTTIEVLSDEILDVTYEIRIYAPTSDVVTVKNVNGTDHTVTLRAAGVTGWQIQLVNPFFPGLKFGLSSDSAFTFYGGTTTLGAVTGTPSSSTTAGSFFTGGGPTTDSYINGSYYRKATYSISVDHLNADTPAPNTITGGVGGMVFTTNMGGFQMTFSPPIPKNNTQNFIISIRVYWARRP